MNSRIVYEKPAWSCPDPKEAEKLAEKLAPTEYFSIQTPEGKTLTLFIGSAVMPCQGAKYHVVASCQSETSS